MQMYAMVENVDTRAAVVEISGWTELMCNARLALRAQCGSTPLSLSAIVKICGCLGCTVVQCMQMYAVFVNMDTESAVAEASGLVRSLYARQS